MDFNATSRPGDQAGIARLADLAVVVGAVLAIVSGFLPFVEQPGTGTSTIKGFQWFGVVYIALAMVIGLVAGLSGRSQAVSRWHSMGLAVINLVLIVGYLVVFDSEHGSLSHGAGLWLLLAAVILQFCALLVGALVESGRLTLAKSPSRSFPANGQQNPPGFATYPPNYVAPGQQYGPPPGQPPGEHRQF